MIVIAQSLDSTMAVVKARQNLDLYIKKYELLRDLDRVLLLTQDIADFTRYLSGIVHVPCATSRSRHMRRILARFAYLRWLYFFVHSFLWLVGHRGEIDLLISENVDSPALLFFSMLFRIPYVVYYHYDVAYQVAEINGRRVIGTLLAALERFAFGKATSVWVTSPSLVSKARRFGAQRVLVIPNWYVLYWDEIQDEKIRRVRTKRSAKPHILFVGRLHPVKQVDLLLRAFHELHKTNPDVNMHILGDGEEREKLAALTRNLGLSKKVHFLGFVDRKTVSEMMLQSAVLALPSKIEGSPRSLIEAMIHKLPIVATNVPGIRDLVEHGKTGYLINHADPIELAHGIGFVLRNREKAERMAERAYTFARENFSRQSVSPKVVRELTSIVPKYKLKAACLDTKTFQERPPIDNVSLSVVIPAFNAERTLERCLTSVLKANPASKEVIVVDDSSTDNTFGIASRFPVRLLRHRSQSGSTVTRNDGLRHSTGEFVAFVDSDIILMENSIEKLLSVLSKNQERRVAGVGGAALPLRRNLVSDSYTVRLFGHSSIETRTQETDSIGTGFAVYRREVLMELGGFDEKFFYGGEDYDLNLRLRKAGYRLLIVPSSKVYHDHPASLQTLARKWFSYGFTFFEVCRRNHLMIEIILPLGWLLSCALLLLTALWSNSLLVWFLFIVDFWIPWVLYYSRQTVRFWFHIREAKHLALPVIHQIVILSRTLGFAYATVKTLLWQRFRMSR